MIPVNTPDLTGNEAKYLQKCIETGWISSDGPFVKQFEKNFSAYLEVGHGIAVCNGTAALETALFASGVGEGDVVIMPTFTIISSAIATIRLGAHPALVDIDPETWCMDIDHLKAVIDTEIKKNGSRLTAIMPVHIYGHPVDMDPVLEISKKYGLAIIEDAAEVHGAEYLTKFLASEDQKIKGVWKKCGSMGHVAAFSFYANKIITTGEGGMVVTDDPEMADRAQSYRNLYFKPERRFYHTDIGYNFRMTNLQAALGLAQLERIEDFIEKKRRLGKYYRQRLEEIPGVRFQLEKPWARSVYWMCSIMLENEIGLTAEDMIEGLKAKGIGSRPFFLGLHEQPVFKDMGLFKGEQYPVAERAHRQGLYLPSGLTLTEESVDQVCSAVKDIIQKERR